MSLSFLASFKIGSLPLYLSADLSMRNCFSHILPNKEPIGGINLLLFADYYFSIHVE